MIEHCLSEYKRRSEEKLYRVYVTDALKAIAENTTHFAGLDGIVDYGTSLSMRWIDALEPHEEVKEKDDRSCNEIVHDIWERINGR